MSTGKQVEMDMCPFTSDYLQIYITNGLEILGCKWSPISLHLPTSRLDVNHFTDQLLNRIDSTPPRFVDTTSNVNPAYSGHPNMPLIANTLSILTMFNLI